MAVPQDQAVAMNSYETSATVEEQGRVLVAGVPFAPGTKVEVTISPIENGHGPDRVEGLLAALDNARNVEPIGAFDLGELYDRHALR